ncbi:oligosaccharide flippase family protein [Steroidobacter agaridevorans]|uniref:oligosaccharide flippase family protein n=1 Tax=Steroidobacter agaridevorans TaxID=2695856 RepID=UPI00132333B7|nr:oligosaccharide flippase family protein [Steroidobacter agaridevorans]GFE87065.1 polysaccharide biosynthesis protein [Steroidobacter agaridevorans]
MTSRSAIDGMTWVFASNTLARLVTVAGQVVVGWLLVPEDFGIYALALSMSAMITALRNGGIGQIMIQRAEELHAKVRLYRNYSLAINALGTLILLAMAAPAFGERTSLALVLTGIALSLPLSAPSLIYRSRLIVDRNFRAVASMTLWSTLLWHASIALLAFAGLGPVSFAIAPLLQASYESIAGRRYAGALPVDPPAHKTQWRDYFLLFADTRWIMLSSAALALATNGVYFAVSALTDTRTVGIFFFAFQLVLALSMPVYSAIETVLPTVLSSLNRDRSQQVVLYARVVRGIAVAGIPFSIVCALLLPWLMNLVWRGKWDIAAPAAQILVTCIPVWLIVNAGRALIDARGLWRVRFWVLSAYAVGGIAVAAVASRYHGTVESIAIALAVFYALFVAVFVMIQTRLGVPWRSILLVLSVAAAISIAALLLALGIAGTSAVAVMLLFVGLAVVGNLLLRHTWQDIFLTVSTYRR